MRRRPVLKYQDPYRVLGLERDATEEQIRAAYFTRVKAVNPERDPEGFESVRRAYERLKDPEERLRAEVLSYRHDVDVDLQELLDTLAEIPQPRELRPLVRQAIAVQLIEEEKQKLAAQLAAALPPDKEKRTSKKDRTRTAPKKKASKKQSPNRSPGRSKSEGQ